MKFVDLRLAEPIARAVAAQGYTDPTPIQAQAIPHVLEGKDVLGCAQTGTGKTAAFALPILHRLFTNPRKAPQPPAPAQPAAAAPYTGAGLPPARPQHKGGFPQPPHNPHHKQPFKVPHHGTQQPQLSKAPRALILAPTRELAVQIADSFRDYGKFTGLRHWAIFGGVGQFPQTRALRDGLDILVATPGRLLDLMSQGFVDLRAIEVFVLDEADRMLDMGFIDDIRRIVSRIPQERQTLFFSATMPPDIRALADQILHEPVRVQVAPQSTPAEKIDQRVYVVEHRNKPVLLEHYIKNTPIVRALVFTRTKHGADRVCRRLVQAGISAEAIHGDKAMGARTRAMQNFKGDKTQILVATDIAARGIDVDGVSHVINYDMANTAETYVHRIGRTARAGASGVSVSFCGPDERGLLNAVQRAVKKNLTLMTDHPEYPARQDREFHDDGGQHRGGHEGQGGGGGFGGRRRFGGGGGGGGGFGGGGGQRSGQRKRRY